MVQFVELFRCAGVDEDMRAPGMVIPFGGSNVVAVGNDGKPVKLVSNNSAVVVEEPDPTDIIRTRNDRQVELSQPGVDGAVKAAYMPHGFYGDTSYFRLHGKRPLGFPGATLEIFAGGKATGQKMSAVVLDKLPVKIAIQNLQVYDSSGALVNHAQKPTDPKRELDMINSIWTPQTQIAFELVTAPPSIVDDRDPKTKKLIADAYGVKDMAYAKLTDTIYAEKAAKIFDPLRVGAADITIYVVERIDNAGRLPAGTTLPGETGIFVCGNRFPSTMAHEIGHYLGGEMKNKAWDPMGHKDDLVYNPKSKSWDLTPEDYRLLMRDGGAGFKIPFAHVKMYRSFRDRRAGKSVH
jgi:hypothetical protein